MIVLLNAMANGGRARARWQAVRPALEQRWLPRGYQLVTRPEGLADRLRREGERVVVAAGGDGTMNRLLELVMAMPEEERGRLVLGAIGLGSSNDLHKPLRAGRSVADVPVLLDASRPVPRSVGRIDLVDGQGRPARRHFLLNASIGIIAAGNHLFNGGGRLAAELKRRWVGGAIWSAALRAVIGTRDVPGRLEHEGEVIETEITSLSLLLSPCFTGSLCYDLELPRDGDRLGVALCERMGLVARLRTLWALAHGRFTGLPGTRVFRAPSARVTLGRTVPLEVDGEVQPVRELEASILPQAVNLCS